MVGSQNKVAENEISLFCTLSVSLKMEKNQDLLLSMLSRYSPLTPSQTIQGGVGNDFHFLPSLEDYGFIISTLFIGFLAPCYHSLELLHFSGSRLIFLGRYLLNHRVTREFHREKEGFII